MSTELSQWTALHVTKSEGERLIARLRGSQFLMSHGVEVYTVPSTEPFVMHDGSKHEGVTVMVRAETDLSCGMGVGFVTAISEGLVK
jgi:hypothetical protein